MNARCSVRTSREAGATDADLQEALDFQRQAQWRLDFIAAENSMGFHAPQEAARVLGEAADMARQGQVKAINLLNSKQTSANTEAEAVLTSAVGPAPGT